MFSINYRIDNSLEEPVVVGSDVGECVGRSNDWIVSKMRLAPLLTFKASPPNVYTILFCAMTTAASPKPTVILSPNSSVLSTVWYISFC